MVVRVQRALLSHFLKGEIRSVGVFWNFLAPTPLLLQRIDVKFDVMQWWMPRRQVFGFQHCSALRAVVLENTTPRWVRRVRSCI